MTQQQPDTSRTVAAIASFFIPGLGQLALGRYSAALGYFFLDALCWGFLLFAILAAGAPGFVCLIFNLLVRFDAANDAADASRPEGEPAIRGLPSLTELADAAADDDSEEAVARQELQRAARQRRNEQDRRITRRGLIVLSICLLAWFVFAIFSAEPNPRY